MFNSPYENSTRFFSGVVENRHDPLKIGRVQVRIFGIHTDNLHNLPEADLHWCQVMTPTTSASNSGIGQTPNLIEGSSVIGFFQDGDNCQQGIILGSINGIPQESRRLDKGFSDHRTNLSSSVVPGKPSSTTFSDGVGVSISESTRLPYPNTLDEPDTSKLARNESADSHHVIISKKLSQSSQKNIPTASGSSFSEPSGNFQAKYPYNHVNETESGHVIELDDTPSQERVHVYHRSGSFMEMLKDGVVIYKSVKDSYNITHGTSYAHVGGSNVITIDSGMSLLINSKSGSQGLELSVGGGGDINIKVVSGNVNLNVTGDMQQTVSGDYVVNVGGRYKVSASRIDLN